MVAEGLAPNSVHNYYVLLNKTLRYALRHRPILFDPQEGVELPKNVRSKGLRAGISDRRAGRSARCRDARPAPHAGAVRGLHWAPRR
jgi:hypothetical protein